MRNLLSAGFSRLWRSKALWLSCAAAAGYEIFSVLSRAPGVREGYTYSYDLDGGFFLFSGLVGILSALLCAFIIGPEYGDGTMRNKIAAGHKRRDVYLANLILSGVSSVLVCLAAVLPGLALGLPLLGMFKMGAGRAAGMILGVLAMSLAYAAVFTAVVMLIPQRTVALTTAVVLALALLMAGAYLNGRLTAPPTVQSYALSVSGQVVDTHPSPNPNYVPEGPWRTVLEFLYDFLPGGQTGQYVTADAPRPGLLILYDAVIFIASTALGMWIFRRKDLK